MDLEMHPRRKPMRSVSSMDMSDSFIEALVTIPKQRFWDSAPGFWMIWHSLTKCHDNWDSLTQTNTQNINLSVEFVSTCLCFNSNNVLEQPRTLNHLNTSVKSCEHLDDWGWEFGTRTCNSIIVLGQRPNPSHPSHLRQSGNSFSDPNTIICRARSTLVAESSNKPKEYPQIALGPGRARCNHSANSLWTPPFQKRLQYYGS
jgi:hypothetical protein